jgi:hypothetical protein
MSEVVGRAFEQDVKWSSSTDSFGLRLDQFLSPSSVFVRKYFHRPVRTLSILLPRIEIMGIPFSVRKEEDRVALESDRWPSLRASADSVPDAISEMQSLLSDVIEEYVMCSEDVLSEDAKEFRHYLINTLI